MPRPVVWAECALLCTCLCLTWLGCSPGRYSSRTAEPICRANLDDCREITLSYDLVRERVGWEPERECEQLRLKVRPREHLELERRLKEIELTPGVPRGELRFRTVEVRTDDARRRVWFVQRDSGRIIATLDSETGVTTGPDDEPPSWATPDGGVSLVLR